MEQEFMDIVTGNPGNTISSAIIVLLIQRVIQEIDDVIHLDDNRRVLQAQLNRMNGLLLDISAGFRDQQREAPVSLKYCLERMQREVGKGRELIHRSQRPWPQQCIDCLLCKPRVSTQMREWKTTINGLFNELSTDFLLVCRAQQIVSAAPPQVDVLLQDLPDTGLIGMKIKDAETQLQSWVSKAPHVRIISVYGMGGVGKTTLLKKVYNNFKVGRIFDHVIWVTVAQFPILELQARIASAINLDLSNSSSNDVDMRKMKLSAYLKNKKFFLVLDDMWSALDLKELGVEFGDYKGSQLIFTTRNKDLIREMNAQESMQIQPLLPEEGWELFWKIAFEDGHVLETIENIARQVAKECQGLPLAIKVIASTMLGNTDVDEWKFALKQLQKVDPNFSLTHPRIDQDLYQRLKYSYDCLPDANLKNCFLYCAMFEEDAIIPVEFLVQMWIAESLIKTKEDAEYEYLLETGKNYVKLLQNHCLFYAAGDDSEYPSINVHDVVRDMAIYIGENEENCVFRDDQSLQHFPDIPASDKCKRISVDGNLIKSLPAKELKCPKLVSLFLGHNFQLEEIPEAFLLSFTSLRLLDLVGLPIKSLPTSLWQLTQLVYIGLYETEIEDISEEISNLSNLQFLHLRSCKNLKSLPSQIGELQNLKYLDIRGCYNLSVIPDEITKLSHCKIAR